jgi:AraC-like DNA-binding protein
MADSADSSVVRFSTADLPENNKIAMWREQYGRIAMKLDIEPADETAFDCAVVARSLPGAQLLAATMSPLRVTRSRELIADGKDDVAFIINRSGDIGASASGQDVALRGGDAVLISGTEVSMFNRHSRGSSLSILIPRPALSSMVDDLDDLHMQRIPHGTGILTLLTAYAAPLLDESLPADPKVRSTTANHLHDLVALALGATRGATQVARYRGLRAARLNTAKAYIAENSNRRDLTVGAVAAHVGVTPRILQRLFERDGTTFTEFLLKQRLNRARRLLTAPNLDQRYIGQIGFEVGFNDLSYFHRVFKRRYGLTPLGMRMRATESGLLEFP